MVIRTSRVGIRNLHRTNEFYSMWQVIRLCRGRSSYEYDPECAGISFRIGSKGIMMKVGMFCIQPDAAADPAAIGRHAEGLGFP